MSDFLSDLNIDISRMPSLNETKRIIEKLEEMRKDPGSIQRLSNYLGSTYRAQRWILKSIDIFSSPPQFQEEDDILRRMRLLAKFDHMRPSKTRIR